MGRIRTIKPEFPQSESVGRISRDARLLFLQLFTLVDDEGRSRGASRMLASLLYPYDADAPTLIDGWLDELEREDHIRRYVVESQTYLEVINFNVHQKIDRPSKSKLPSFANPRDDSSSTREKSPRIKDQVSSIKEGDQGEDTQACAASSPSLPDTVDTRILCEQVGIFRTRDQEEMNRCYLAFCQSSGMTVDAARGHMISRWKQFQASAPQMQWQWGSAHGFFMSGKWDDPQSWPRDKQAQLESKYTEFLKGED